MRTDGYGFCRGESQHLTGIANRCARCLWGELSGGRSFDVGFNLAVQRHKPIAIERSSATGRSVRSVRSVRGAAAEAQDLVHAAGGAQQRRLVEATGHELHGERQSIGAEAAG